VIAAFVSHQVVGSVLSLSAVASKQQAPFQHRPVASRFCNDKDFAKSTGRGSDAQCQPFAANARALRTAGGHLTRGGYPVLFHFPLQQRGAPHAQPGCCALRAAHVLLLFLRPIRRKDLRGWNGRCLRNYRRAALRRVWQQPARHRSSWCRPAGPTSICRRAPHSHANWIRASRFLLGFPTRVALRIAHEPGYRLHPDATAGVMDAEESRQLPAGAAFPPGARPSVGHWPWRRGFSGI